MKTHFHKLLLLCFLAAFSITGCAKDQSQTVADGKPPADAAQKDSVYKGKIAGKSNKAKTVSITVGKGDQTQTVMLKFNDQTTGLQFAEKGEAAIITYKIMGSDKIATEIKPKLAKLPEGVTEIKTEELKSLLDSNVDIFLADARPASRYNQAHLPGAVSVPVAKLKKEKSAVLPKDKGGLLVFYCGGPT